MVKFFDIDLAFNFVIGTELGMNSAYLCRDTGQVYYQSDLGDSDELPEDLEESDRYIEIPNKHDLNLGSELVREFMNEYLPEKADEVECFFRSKGAYSRFKKLLSHCDAIEKWYEFEQRMTESALRDWCSQNNIEIEEVPTDSVAIGSSREKIVNYSVEFNPQSTDLDILSTGVNSYGRSVSGSDAMPIACFVRLDGELDGQVVAGISGRMEFSRLFIKYLWVNEQHRKQGIASRLLTELETAARSRGCQDAVIETLLDEVSEICSRRGYEVLAIIPNYVGRFTRRILRKIL